METDDFYMGEALAAAREGLAAGEVPVGAVVVGEGGKILARAFNQPIALHDPTAHAEVLALRQAAALVGNYRLPGVSLYVTMEPCLMCVGALIARPGAAAGLRRRRPQGRGLRVALPPAGGWPPESPD